MKSVLRAMLPVLALLLMSAKAPESHSDSLRMQVQPLVQCPDAQMLQAHLIDELEKQEPTDLAAEEKEFQGKLSKDVGKQIAVNVRQKKKGGDHWGFWALLSGFSIWALLRRKKLRPQKRHKTHIAQGLKIALGILVLLAFLAGGALSALAILKLSIALFWQVGLACMSGLVAVIILGIGFYYLIKALDIDFDWSGWLPAIFIAVPLIAFTALLIGTLVFWMFLNVFLPLAIAFFPSGAVMGTMVTAAVTGFAIMGILIDD